MIDESLQTQAALYALDALPAGEATAFRAQLFGNPELAALVAEYEDAAALLAETVPHTAPPAELRARILETIAPKRAAIPAPGLTWLPWGVAAALAIACAWLLIGSLAGSGKIRALSENLARLRSENGALLDEKSAIRAQLLEAQARITTLMTERATSAREIASLRETITSLEKRSALAETQVATLTSKLDASYLASIAWDKNSQEGVLHVRRLPETASHQDYQLWVVDPQYKFPVNAGVFKVRPDGSATIHFAPNQRVTNATAFAITLEREGGVPKAEGPLIMSN